MSKFYAVKNGRKKGIFNTWDECKKQVNQFPNAIFKSFSSLSEAEKFLGKNEDIKIEDFTNIKDENEFKNEYEAVAYVDGSFNVKKGIYGYGVILFLGDEKKCYYGSGENIEFAKHRNVAGEILGSIKAVKLALENRCRSILINYDYNGIEFWADKSWKCNTDLTKKYSEFMNSQENIKIYFSKVKAHSGNKYNDEADKLAKKAVGI